MIEVKMKTISAGPGGNFGIGDKCLVSEVEARMLVDGGYAEYAVLSVPVTAQETPEKAVIKPEQTAVIPVATPKPETAAKGPDWSKK